MGKIFLTYIIIINVAGFYLMKSDKRRAREREWRIKERTLWVYAFVGGAAGLMTAMYIYRHKTKHLSFRAGLPLLAALQFILSFLIYMFMLNLTVKF